MQNKDINIELEPIDIRKSHVHSCPAVAVPVEGESIGSFLTDNSKVSFEEEPNTAHYFNKKAKKESDIQKRQLRSLRKVKSAQPVNDPSGRQINKNRSDSSDDDGPSPLRMPQLDEGKDDTLPGLLSDFKGPPLPRRVWSWLFCLSLVLYYTAVLAMMMRLLVFRLEENPFPLDSTSGAILYIAENYRFDPIMNVNLTSEECPTGFTEAKLTTWPGTRDGCYTLEDGDLEPKLCDNVGSLDQESVYSISQQDLYIWKGYKWCIQRASQGLDYVFTESCPDGFRNCAAGYCFKESLSCPITGLTLRDANSSIPDGSKLLTIRRDEDELPMISINVSMNGLPCFSLDEDPPSESPYILLKTHENGCVSFGEDQSSFEIDRDVQEDFLQDNNVPSSILNLPGYDSILESTPAILVGRRKLNVAPTSFCKNLDIDVFEKAGNSIQNLNTAYTSIVISVVILHIMIGLVLTGFFCGRGLLKRSLGLILWRGRLCYRIFFLVFFALEVTAITTLAIYAIIYKAKLDSVGSYFNQVISSGCFSQTQAQNVIASFSKFKSENIDLIFIYSLVSAGIALIFLIILSRAVCYARKPSSTV